MPWDHWPKGYPQRGAPLSSCQLLLRHLLAGRDHHLKSSLTRCQLPDDSVGSLGFSNKNSCIFSKKSGCLGTITSAGGGGVLGHTGGGRTLEPPPQALSAIAQASQQAIGLSLRIFVLRHKAAGDGRELSGVLQLALARSLLGCGLGVGRRQLLIGQGLVRRAQAHGLHAERDQQQQRQAGEHAGADAAQSGDERVHWPPPHSLPRTSPLRTSAAHGHQRRSTACSMAKAIGDQAPAAMVTRMMETGPP